MVKKQSKRYTKTEKANAVTMYLEGPEGLREVSHALGISVSSLALWVQLHYAKVEAVRDADRAAENPEAGR